VLAHALAWLERAREPFFLWLHVMDPHHPYDPATMGPWEIRDDPAFVGLRARWAGRAVGEQTERLRAVHGPHDLGRDELSFLVGRYDSEILQVDAGLERLAAGLRRRGALDSDTWLVVTADHGEEFLDHGGMLHGHTLFDELLHVPLVVRGPGVPPGLRVAAQVPLVDVAATLLEAARLPVADLDARSLSPFWRAPGREPWRPVVASRGAKYLAYRSPDSKLVVAFEPYPPAHPPGSGLAALRWMARIALDRVVRPKVGLWRLGAEPREREDARGDAGEMRLAYASLESLRRAHPPRRVASDPASSVDAAAVERLRALGYAD
jgi:hypothetical protein